MNLKDISATVLTKNSQKHLKDVLKALAPFGEILLYDTGSADGTIEIARTFPNVKVIENRFIGFGPTHNMASTAAKNDWILSIDSDEIATPELAEALKTVGPDPHAVYSFPRRNFFNGKFIKWCGWYPDRQIRLYNRTKTRFTDDHVHEAIISTGMRHVPLSAAIIHYSYGSIADFLSKMESYSTLFAAQNCGKKNSSLRKALTHGWFAFFKSYFLKRGFLGGYEGFVISAYNGHTAYYKYLKLYEANSAPFAGPGQTGLSRPSGWDAGP
jgi:glycosyltransferase involved in cell wall biosynthesis